MFFSSATRLGVTAAFGRPPLSLATATVAAIASQRIILVSRLRAVATFFKLSVKVLFQRSTPRQD